MSDKTAQKYRPRKHTDAKHPAAENTNKTEAPGYLFFLRKKKEKKKKRSEKK